MAFAVDRPDEIVERHGQVVVVDRPREIADRGALVAGVLDRINPDDGGHLALLLRHCERSEAIQGDG